MVHKFLQYTRKGGDTVRLTLCPIEWIDSDWQVVEASKSQNRIRHCLAVLDKTIFCGHPILEFRDAKLTFDGSEYRLWAYQRNWHGKGMFWAGVLVGKQHLWKKLQRKRGKRISTYLN